MMANPMLGMLNQSRMVQNLAPIKNMMNMIRGAGNPQMMLNQMVSQNPQMQQVMQYVKQNGGDAKSAFYKLANERGMNPDDVLNMLK